MRLTGCSIVTRSSERYDVSAVIGRSLFMDSPRDREDAAVDGPLGGSYDRRTVITGAGALAAGLLIGGPSSALASRFASAPKRGGVLRVGLVGNGPNEVLDPQNQQNVIDTATDRVLFDTLARQRADGSLEPRLALAFEPNKAADVWTVHLRDGVEWHDGKPFTAQDVAYSYRRIVAKKLAGAGTLTFVDPHGIKVLDKHTVRFHLNSPYALFDIAAATSTNIIVRNGAGLHPFTTSNLVGTGPFKLGSIIPGVRSKFLRNPNYFDHG